MPVQSKWNIHFKYTKLNNDTNTNAMLSFLQSSLCHLMYKIVHIQSHIHGNQNQIRLQINKPLHMYSKHTVYNIILQHSQQYSALWITNTFDFHVAIQVCDREWLVRISLRLLFVMTDFILFSVLQSKIFYYFTFNLFSFILNGFRFFLCFFLLESLERKNEVLRTMKKNNRKQFQSIYQRLCFCFSQILFEFYDFWILFYVLL